MQKPVTVLAGLAGGITRLHRLSGPVSQAAAPSTSSAAGRGRARLSQPGGSEPESDPRHNFRVTGTDSLALPVSRCHCLVGVTVRVTVTVVITDHGRILT